MCEDELINFIDKNIGLMELIEKVIPKTEFHILPKDVNILRVNAKRVCERNKKPKV